ncbi:hypothetical protein C448_05368 [Halococcus morrhuae DSM 1307]|uniref:Uncharacterized protein n=1 Tax=Halococcus morrhuae DSM 1307 TaxID=931277 RepID=M0MNW2_HALMO|nr:hypothetical protein C448_05368 [Halococcus morrhuae DSM 1307]
MNSDELRLARSYSGYGRALLPVGERVCFVRLLEPVMEEKSLFGDRFRRDRRNFAVRLDVQILLGAGVCR